MTPGLTRQLFKCELLGIRPWAIAGYGINKSAFGREWISVVHTATERVKRWRKGDTRLRWSTAGPLAAEKRFQRVRGYKSMAVLPANVDAYDPRLAGKPEAA